MVKIDTIVDMTDSEDCPEMFDNDDALCDSLIEKFNNIGLHLKAFDQLSDEDIEKFLDEEEEIE